MIVIYIRWEEYFVNIIGIDLVQHRQWISSDEAVYVLYALFDGRHLGPENLVACLYLTVTNTKQQWPTKGVECNICGVRKFTYNGSSQPGTQMTETRKTIGTWTGFANRV